MRLAALCSGGKDSVLSMYLAHQSGHEICYVVGISSPGESWIFHTPNAWLVPMIADAMGIRFKGAETDGTEAGDMEALRSALGGLDAEGVIMGGIWSDYQWDRINNICGDLGLMVYAPLWRKNQSLVYDEIGAAGIEAIIVGTFAEGLDETYLGCSLDAACKERLIKAGERIELSVTGEGGEYESLVLDSPMHTKRLAIRKERRDVSRGSSLLTVEEATLENKGQN